MEYVNNIYPCTHIRIMTFYIIRIISYIYVALHGTPSTLGVPYHINHIIYIHFRPFLRRHALDMLHLKHVILFVNVTSFDDAVTSYMTSQHCRCIGHMTVYYKRAANTLVGGVSVSLLVRKVQPSHPRPS